MPHSSHLKSAELLGQEPAAWLLLDGGVCYVRTCVCVCVCVCFRRGGDGFALWAKSNQRNMEEVKQKESD